MTVEEGLRGLAGVVVLGSLALGFWVHAGFLLLTAFVGANLLRSAFTGTCPAMLVLRRLGLPDAAGHKH
jgi:UPF0716 family protein affecting phage T7 exclusion